MRDRSPDLVAALAIVAALAFWLLSLPLMDPAGLDDFGLVAILPWTYWAALGWLSLGFSLSLHPSSRWRALPGVALILLVIALHATPPIVYGTLRFSWAWKHIGIVDYLQRHAEVDRTIPFLAAYHNWPGFFWLSAGLANLLRLEPLQIAGLVRFFPVVANLVYLALLRSIYRRFTIDMRLVHAALWLFVCANWVGQDYFSPQAFAYALYLLVLALCLGPLMPEAVRFPSRPGQWVGRTRARLNRFASPAPACAPWRRILAVITVFAAVVGIVASHQLTPLALAFSLIGLAVVTPLSFGYPVLLLFALAYWLIYPAAPFTAQNLPLEVAQLGQTVGGVTDKMVDTSSVSSGLAVVTWAARALSASMVLMAIFGGWRRLRAGERDGVLALLALAPFLLLGLTTYGGEAVFRVYFFSLPFLSLLCAAGLAAREPFRSGAAARVGFALLALVLSIAFLLANNGKDRLYRFSAAEVEAAAWLYRRSPPGTLLVEGARNYPSQFMNYENFTYLPLANESRQDREEILADPGRILGRWFADPGWSDGYVVLTRSQQAYVEAFGITPGGAFEQLALALLASPDFVLVFANEHARIFRARRFARP